VNYRSVADLNADIRRWIPRLPDNIDVVVGIPRSGMLAANLLALHMNVALTDVAGLCEGRLMQCGRRGKDRVATNLDQPRQVLVVDDSASSGAQMRQVKAVIRQAGLQHHIRYAAVYVTPQAARSVDFWCVVLPSPRCFEWNVMHHGTLPKWCVDLDGVLCRDPTEEENDDGPRYQEFIRNVPPLVRPTRPIGWVVTCRLEKYRQATEEWLTRHGIRAEHLIMMDFPDKESRIAAGLHAGFKAKVLRESGAQLFVESSERQAIEIARLSGRYVLCVGTGQMIAPDGIAKGRRLSRRFIEEFLHSPRTAFRMTARYVATRIRQRRAIRALFRSAALDRSPSSTFGA